MKKRTTHRSTAGTKLYAVRNTDGTFDDMQTYKRAHGSDVQRTSTAEAASGSRKKVAKKVAKKAKASAGKRASRPAAAKAKKAKKATRKSR